VKPTSKWFESEAAFNAYFNVTKWWRPQDHIGFRGPNFYSLDDGWPLPQGLDGIKQCIQAGRGPSAILDIETHIGPSGRLVYSRSDRRDEFKRSETYEWEPTTSRPRGDKGFAADGFCAKRGIKPADEAKQWMADEFAPIEKSFADEATSLAGTEFAS
jgi:hypothetical protein